ncbi:MAG: PAS domain-containing protein [candidate division Zixibacteria bacterium]|nr:PAS domain-containing protein [candidate division Zixibacteria bacterium]
MKALETNPLLKTYSWTISSLYRIALAAAVISIILISLSLFASPVVFGIVAAGLVFGLGFAAHRVRHSGAALDYPGIDRFFQQVPCYLSIQDKDMRIIRANRLFKNDFGDNLIGELCYKAYKGSEEVCPNCPVLKTFEDGQTHSTEETVITRNGEEARMIVYTTPVTNEEGSVVGVMEMSTNITEIKRLQDEIEASRREFRNLFEMVPCLISILDKDFRIQRVNKLFEQELGDSTGKYCYEVYRGYDTICPDCHAQKTFEDGQIHNGEKTLIKKDGTEARLVVYSAPILDEKGEVKGVMEMATDITEIKKLQRELTMMGKTIAVMAHRIKNILMGLEGGIFVVNTGMEEGDDATVKQGWQMIERNVKNVSGIVKDLLYCSKEREMKFDRLDPAEIVRNVYELFKGRTAKEGIEFNFDVPETMPRGNFDSEALHSLFSNLVTNAIDACVNDSAEGKEKHIISLRGRMNGDGGYIFEVEDNGSGIPGVVGENVFEDFFSTKGREGTGLGLLVAQKVAEAHKGIITFCSDEGKGTTFKATFPNK